ncbi:MAG: OmpH family outer membrane protein [Bacteroidetes bacterium]|nr:OmpH family outer membrane protein [Bacteroidota bacterium]
MKNVLFAIFTLIVLTLFSNDSAFSQATRLPIGIVDVEAVVKEMPEAIAADKELTDLSNLYRDTIAEKRTAFETKLQNYQKQKGTMSASSVQAEEEKLLKEQQELNEYQQAKQDEINRLREKYLDSIRPKVKTAIETIAKREKLSLVLAKEAAVVIWSEDKLDITFDVIALMKKGG